MRHVGWRIDCLGDMGFWRDRAGRLVPHAGYLSPEQIITSGMGEAWKKAPVSIEICGTFTHLAQKAEATTGKMAKYIFDRSPQVAYLKFQR